MEVRQVEDSMNDSILVWHFSHQTLHSCHTVHPQCVGTWQSRNGLIAALPADQPTVGAPYNTCAMFGQPLHSKPNSSSCALLVGAQSNTIQEVDVGKAHLDMVNACWLHNLCTTVSVVQAACECCWQPSRLRILVGPVT